MIRPELLAALKPLVDERAKKALADDGGVLTLPPEIEICDEQPTEDGGLVLWLLIDFITRHDAQSGSDTYDHYIDAGAVKVLGGKVVASAVDRALKQYVSEYLMEWAPVRYDQLGEVTAFRKKWWPASRDVAYQSLLKRD